MYTYNAYVTKVYDGDTITVDIDLGFGIILKKQKLRLYGLNAPEVRGENKTRGLEVRDTLRELILNQNIIVKTVKDKKGKYGRWLATIIYDDQNINEWLLQEGMAEKYQEKK